MTEWNGDPLWWQDGVQLLVNALETSASPISPPPDSITRASVATPVMSCDGTSATNARLSHIAVDGRSTPCSSSTGDHAKASHISKKGMNKPPNKQQPWFEFLVSFSDTGINGGQQDGQCWLHNTCVLAGTDTNMSYTHHITCTMSLVDLACTCSFS